MALSKLLKTLHGIFLSEETKERSEKVILSIAIISFIIHLLVIYIVDFGVISLNDSSDLLANPISAIYTPFSFILLYEVYLLIYYLPKSFTTYIGKMYEIMTLIVIRRLFKDLSNLNLSSDWFKIKYDLQFTYDLVTSLIMFFLIYIFYLQSREKYIATPEKELNMDALSKFIQIKKTLATFLVPIFILLSIYSFVSWLLSITYSVETSSNSFANLNNIFFEQFFNILIFADVLVLLSSFFLTDQFHKVIRNSGFIISTILIRISFSTTGIVNNLLIICSITFGLIIIVIYNKFEKQISLQKINSNETD